MYQLLRAGVNLVRRREPENAHSFMQFRGHGLGMGAEELISWLEGFEMIFRSWIGGQHWGDLADRLSAEVQRVPRAVTVCSPLLPWF